MAALTEQKKQLPTLTAKLQAYQQALPSGVTDMTNFLRQLQDSGNAVNVDVSGITVGPPAPSDGPAVRPGAADLPDRGRHPDRPEPFLDRLQNGRRAGLCDHLGGDDRKRTGEAAQVTASLSMKAFDVPDATTPNLTT